jgi:diguanylate cyclase (GGDEF) domain
MKVKEKTAFRGIPANAIIVPLEIVLIMLLALIVFLVFEVNHYSNQLSSLMENSGVYILELTDLQAGINTLSETASGFVQSPGAEDGSTNIGPLMAFAQELGRDRRGPQIAERFHGYDVRGEVRTRVDRAAETTETMRAIQDHAIALVRSVYPLPPIPELSVIPDIPLTEEELAMPAEARIGLARRLLGGEYAQLKYAVAEDVGESARILQQEFSRAAEETRRHLANLRTNLWIDITCIIVMLFVAFLLLRLWVVRPLIKHVEEINADESMVHISRIREMRVLVGAYNNLLRRRNKLETILRSAAETDALTGLPNRYSLERSMLETGGDGGPMAVLVYDVNYLKQVNDTEGHLAGDRLLRTAAECIRECFGDNCYRIGGDEFAAVLRDCDEAEIRARLNRFALAQKRENISISAGYSFARETEEGSFNKLLAEADRHMYEKKQRIHKRNVV